MTNRVSTKYVSLAKHACDCDKLVQPQEYVAKHVALLQIQIQIQIHIQIQIGKLIQKQPRAPFTVMSATLDLDMNKYV